MKFTWQSRYVDEGQTEPDKHGRWALDLYIHVKIDLFPHLAWLKEDGQEYFPIRVASMTKRGTENARVPSLINTYSVVVPSFHDAPNLGLSDVMFLYDEDIEALKTKVEKEFLLLQKVFKNTLEA